MSVLDKLKIGEKGMLGINDKCLNFFCLCTKQIVKPKILVLIIPVLCNGIR